VYRSAADTAKILKKIHEIQENNSWAKHLVYINYTLLKDYFINQLLYSNKSFIKIKQEYIEQNK